MMSGINSFDLTILDVCSGLGHRRAGGNSFLDQILLVELGIGTFKVIVSVGNFNLLGWSLVMAAMTTTSTTMSTAWRTAAFVRLQFTHLLSHGVNSCILHRLFLSIRLWQLGHGGSHRSSCSTSSLRDSGQRRSL